MAQYTVVNVTSVPSPGLGRNEYVNWVNVSLSLQIKKVEEMCTGAAYCQLFSIAFPGAINLKKIKFSPKQEYEYINNFKILQGSFSQLKVEKTILIEKLVKGKFQDNFEFLQWFREFYYRNYDPERSQGSSNPAQIREDAAKKGVSGTRVPSSGSNSAIQPASGTTRTPLTKPASIKAPAKKTPEPKRTTSATRPDSVNSEQLEKRLEEAQLIIADSDQKLKEYEQYTEHASIDLEQCTKERDFYFSKLRKIEVLIQEHIQPGDGLLESLLVILYETEEGFTLPPEEEPPQAEYGNVHEIESLVGAYDAGDASETY